MVKNGDENGEKTLVEIRVPWLATRYVYEGIASNRPIRGVYLVNTPDTNLF